MRLNFWPFTVLSKWWNSPGQSPALELPQDEHVSVRVASITAPSKIKDDLAGIPLLTEIIKNAEGICTREALANIRKPAIPALIELFKENDDQAFIELLTIGEPAVSPLIDLFKDPDENIRDRASLFLAEMNVSGVRGIAPALRQALKDNDPLVLTYALKSLSKTRFSCIQELSPDISEFLKNPDENVRAAAVKVLGRFSKKAEEILPHLERALTDPKPSVRAAVIAAIGRVGARGTTWNPKLNVLPTIIAVSKDPEPIVRIAAAKEFTRGIFINKESILRLVQLAADPEPAVKETANAIILRIGKPALKIMLELLQKDSKTCSTLTS